MRFLADWQNAVMDFHGGIGVDIPKILQKSLLLDSFRDKSYSAVVDILSHPDKSFQDCLDAIEQKAISLSQAKKDSSGNRTVNNSQQSQNSKSGGGSQKQDSKSNNGKANVNSTSSNGQKGVMATRRRALPTSQPQSGRNCLMMRRPSILRNARKRRRRTLPVPILRQLPT